MPHTLPEKILARASGQGEVSPGDLIWAKVDVAMMHDNNGPHRIAKDFAELGQPIWDLDKVVLVADHHTPPSDDHQARIQSFTRKWAKEQGIKYFFDTEGICHTLLVERGFVRPGRLITGTDSHACNAGALGAFAVSVGATENIGVLTTGEIWLRVPESILLRWSGRLQEGVMAKDMILKALGELKEDGAEYQVMEWTGEGVFSLPLDERVTLTNMAIEFSAKTGIIEPDGVVEEYCSRFGPRDWESFKSDPDARYSQKFDFDASSLEPQLACPPRMDNVHGIGEVEKVEIHRAHVGSCTGAKYEDLEAAARVLKGRRVARHCQMLVAPASKEILKKAAETGVLQTLLDAGASLLPTVCGLCAGTGIGLLGPGEVCVTSINRNYPGRMGSREAQIYLASPATVAASAIAGHIADPREFLTRG